MAGIRIIAGKWKGRKLQAPPGLTTRPLTDRIRESLFSWMGHDLSGLRCIDCFSGSGAFAFEALSRGAEVVHCIERDAAAITCLQANAQALGAEHRFVLHRVDARSATGVPTDNDIAFCDPPFPWFKTAPQDVARCLEALTQRVQPQGYVFLRGERGAAAPMAPAQWHESDHRRYGRSWISCYGADDAAQE